MLKPTSTLTTPGSWQYLDSLFKNSQATMETPLLISILLLLYNIIHFAIHQRQIPSFNSLPHKTLKQRALENIVGKGENPGNQHFLLFPLFISIISKSFHLGNYISELFGKVFNSWLLTTLGKKPFENIVGKGENAGNQHFLLFPQCFQLFQKQISFLWSHFFCCLQML